MATRKDFPSEDGSTLAKGIRAILDKLGDDQGPSNTERKDFPYRNTSMVANGIAAILDLLDKGVGDGSVTTDKIANGAVTGDKLGVPYWDWAEDGVDTRLAIIYDEG